MEGAFRSEAPIRTPDTVLNDPGSSDAAKRGTRHTLVGVMETVLRLIHPLTPFISEEIWQRMAPLAGVRGDTVMRQPYPAPEEDRIDRQAIEEIDWVRGFIMGVRKIRSGMSIDPRKPLPVRRTRMLLLCNDRDEVLLEKRPPTGIWAGCGAFPKLTTAPRRRPPPAWIPGSASR